MYNSEACENKAVFEKANKIGKSELIGWDKWGMENYKT